MPPREKYQCDAAIVWCFDNRFQLGFAKFLKRRGVVNSDPIKIAGGAKCLASPEHEGDRQFVLDQIRKSMHLHGNKAGDINGAFRLWSLRRTGWRLRWQC